MALLFFDVRGDVAHVLNSTVYRIEHKYKV